MSFSDSYTAFLRRFRYIIILIWVGAIVAGAFFVLTFLDHTTLEFVPPEGTAARTALDLKHDFFPNHTSDMAVVIYLRSSSSLDQQQQQQHHRSPPPPLPYGIKAITDIPSVAWYVNVIDFELSQIATTELHTQVQIGNFYFLQDVVNASALAAELLSVPYQSALVVPLLLKCEFTSEACRTFAQRAVDVVYGVSTLNDVLRNSTLNLDLLSSHNNNITTIAQVEKLSKSLSVGITGMPELVTSFVHEIKGEMERMDIIVLPIALCIMAMTMKSLRLLILPLLSIGLTLLIGFSIMYGVTFLIPVSSAAPPLMMTLCIAMGIDYNLFILSRFSDEVRASSSSSVAPCSCIFSSSSDQKKKNTTADDHQQYQHLLFGEHQQNNAQEEEENEEEAHARHRQHHHQLVYQHAVANTIRTAGHTVLISGLTLTASFVALVFFPTNVLKSFGIACSATIVVALCVCLNFTPTILLTFQDFFEAGAVPILIDPQQGWGGGRGCVMSVLRLFGFENAENYHPAANRVVLKGGGGGGGEKQKPGKKEREITRGVGNHQHGDDDDDDNENFGFPSSSADGGGARGSSRQQKRQCSSVVNSRGQYVVDEREAETEHIDGVYNKNIVVTTSPKSPASPVGLRSSGRRQHGQVDSDDDDDDDSDDGQYRIRTGGSAIHSTHTLDSSSPRSSSLYDHDPQLTALELAIQRSTKVGKNDDETTRGRSMSPKGPFAGYTQKKTKKNLSDDLMIPDDVLGFSGDDEEDEEDDDETSTSDDDDGHDQRVSRRQCREISDADERQRYVVAAGTGSAAYGSISDSKLVEFGGSSVVADDDERSRLLPKNHNKNKKKKTKKASSAMKKNKKRSSSSSSSSGAAGNKNRIFLFSEKAYRTSVFRHVEHCLKLPWSILLVVLLSTLAGLSAWQASQITVEDATSAFLARGSRSATAYETLQKYFGQGAMMPYRLMFSIDKKKNAAHGGRGGNSRVTHLDDDLSASSSVSSAATAAVASPDNDVVAVDSVLDEAFVDFAHLVITTVSARTDTPLHLFRGPYVINGELVNSSEIALCKQDLSTLLEFQLAASSASSSSSSSSWEHQGQQRSQQTLHQKQQEQEKNNGPSFAEAIIFFKTLNSDNGNSIVSSKNNDTSSCDRNVLVMLLDSVVVNKERTAAMVLMTCPVDPTGADGTHYYDALLDAIAEAEAIQRNINKNTKSDENNKTVVLANVNVLGLGAETMDAMRVVYNHFPLIAVLSCVAVMVMVAISFRSIIVPLRCILSIAFTEAFVFGATVLVYQKGILNGLGIENVSGHDSMLWLSPIVAFCVVVGVALDYDIFLLTRVVEIVEMEKRETGPATIRALCSTGKVITSAGLIMGIAFFGLLMSNIRVLNELGFMLVVAVLFDTFVVRTFLVPSAMTLLGKMHWWPSNLEHPSIERKRKRAEQRRKELAEEHEIAQEIEKNASFSYYAVDTGGRGGAAAAAAAAVNKAKKNADDESEQQEHDDDDEKNRSSNSSSTSDNENATTSQKGSTSRTKQQNTVPPPPPPHQQQQQRASPASSASSDDSSTDKEDEFLANPYARGSSRASSSRASSVMSADE